MQGTPLNLLDNGNLLHFGSKFGLLEVIENDESSNFFSDINISELKKTEFNFSSLAKVFKTGHKHLEKLEEDLKDIQKEIDQLGSCYDYINMAQSGTGLIALQRLITNPELHQEFNNIFLKIQNDFHKNYQLEISKRTMAFNDKKKEIENYKKDLQDIQKIVTDLAPTIDINDFSYAKAATKSLECPICATYEVTHAIYGCGHTYCGSCMDTIKTTNKCPTCNGNFMAAPLRIYFSS